MDNTSPWPAPDPEDCAMQQEMRTLFGVQVFTRIPTGHCCFSGCDLMPCGCCRRGFHGMHYAGCLLGAFEHLQLKQMLRKNYE